MHEISLATKSDIPEIAKIYNVSIMDRNATADLKPKNIAELENWFKDHTKTNNRPIYVMRNNSNKIIAWSSFSDYKNKAAYYISSEISIYVDKNERGNGIGSEFLEFMLTIAPNLNIKNIVAIIFANNTASLMLFKKFGFKQWGFLPKMCDMQSFIADIFILGKSLM